MEKLKQFVLFLVAVILLIFIIKYLKIVGFIKKILIILVPLFIGIIYAWFVNPMVNKLSKKIKRNIASIVLFLFIMVFIVSIIYFMVPVIYKEISELVKVLPDMFNRMESRIDNIGLKEYLDKILVFLVDNVPIYLIDLVKHIFKYIGVIGVGLILGLYISMDYNSIVLGIEKLVPKKYNSFFVNLVQDVSDEVRKCVHGTLLVAFFVFIMDSLLFMLIGLDAPLIFGAICGLTDLIPYIGPYIGGIIAIGVGFTKSKMVGILAIVVCVLVQTIENYVLQPMVMSKSIKIRPALIIIGLLLFGNIFGVLGMIIATPCVAIIKVVLEHFLALKEKN